MTFIKRGSGSSYTKLMRKARVKAIKATEPREPKEPKPFLDGYKSHARRYGRDR